MKFKQKRFFASPKTYVIGGTPENQYSKVGTEQHSHQVWKCPALDEVKIQNTKRHLQLSI